MVPIHVRVRVSEDGSLVLQAPPAYRGREVEAFLVLQTLDVESSVSQDDKGWPADFFEQTAGQWQGEFERPEQGSYEARNPLP